MSENTEITEEANLTVMTGEPEEKIDGRTVEGKNQSRIEALENEVMKIQEILVEHEEKIKALSIRR